jgi:hypothetical protein
MTYCFNCGKYTPGKPLFCSRCGRSYDVKLCPRLHPNSRSAQICSQCGSSELSNPQPKVSIWAHILAFVLRMLIGAFLVLLSVLVLSAILIELLRRSEVQNGLVAIGILVGVLWLIWTKLPDWLRELIRKSMRRKEPRNGH